MLLPLPAALAVSACARQQPTYYAIDPNSGQQMHGDVPLGLPLRPGDTVVARERWF